MLPKIATNLIILAIVIATIIVIFEIWMFIDALKNKKLTDSERPLWLVGMLCIHPFVAIAYYFVARTNKTDTP